VVVGIGLNVSLRPDELPLETATSLRIAEAATTDRDTVLRAVLRALAARYVTWRESGGEPPRGAYREASATLGRRVRVDLPGGGTVASEALDVDARRPARRP
jgi:BirA family biotin operon repressor/biotin-[acetyl-CoA-carboxylase] ligase